MKKRHSAICLYLAAAMIFCCNNATALEFKVAVFEFDVNSSEDLTYIRSGMSALLASRITVPGKIAVIDGDLIKKVLAGKSSKKVPLSEKLLTAKTLGADFLLCGSISKIGNSISIDSRLADVKDRGQTMPVYIQTTGLDNIIPEIKTLAEKIKRMIVEGPKIPDTSQYKDSAAKTEKSGPEPVSENHSPEKREKPHLLKEEPLYAAVENPPEHLSAPKLQGLIKAPPFFQQEPFFTFNVRNQLMYCLASGDINGDGKRELLMAGEGKILIFEISETTLKQCGEIETEVDESIVHIDAADLNGNGIDEIYASSYQGQHGNSFVVEYSEKKYKRIADSKRWFYRAYGDWRQGVELTGQKTDLQEPFSGAVHRLEWKHGKLLTRDEVILPGGLGIYSFTEGDIDSDGSREYVVFSRGKFSSGYNLSILSYTGRVEWTDHDKLGGSPNSFVINRFGDDLEQTKTVPLRILCEDINSDGRLDVIVARNSKEGKNLIKKIIFYDQGEVLCLQWDGSDLVASWKSGLLHDYVTDYILEDFDNDGQKELYILSVAEEGFFGKTNNRITGFKVLEISDS